MRTIAVRACLCVSFALCAPVVQAQQRDAVLDEQRQEQALTECNDDPQCVAGVRRMEAREAANLAAYDRKSRGEKAFGWLEGLGFLAVVIGLYTFVLGGKRKRKERR